MAGYRAWVAAAMLIVASTAWPAESGHQHREPLRGVHSLDLYVDGDVLHVLTGEYPASAKAPQLRYRRSTDGGNTWSAPFRVDSGIKPYQLIHRGNDAQIAARGRQLVAVWHTPGTGYSGSGPLATAISSDGGASWQPGPNPADEPGTGGRGYIDVAADAQGFHLAWLDSRGGKQALYYAGSRDGGRTWTRNTELAPQTCECCWNTLVTAPRSAAYLMYRAIDPRDLLLVASADGGASWKPRGPVGRFDWKVNTCPHTGGALAPAADGVLHALSWTGRDGAAGLHALSSRDGGATWTKPRRLGSDDARRADIAVAGDGRTVAAAWDQFDGKARRIHLATSADGGATWAGSRQLSGAGVDALYPRVVPVPRGFLVLWTEQKDGRPSLLHQERITSP